jgi:hypothetical protein
MSHIHTDPSDVEFNKQFIIVDFTKKEINGLKNRLRKLETKLKKETEKLQSICNHNYIRECINDSCYREYATICNKCYKEK